MWKNTVEPTGHR